jgi:hypothetical protein
MRVIVHAPPSQHVVHANNSSDSRPERVHAPDSIGFGGEPPQEEKVEGISVPRSFLQNTSYGMPNAKDPYLDLLMGQALPQEKPSHVQDLYSKLMAQWIFQPSNNDNAENKSLKLPMAFLNPQQNDSTNGTEDAYAKLVMMNLVPQQMSSHNITHDAKFKWLIAQLALQQNSLNDTQHLLSLLFPSIGQGSANKLLTAQSAPQKSSWVNDTEEAYAKLLLAKLAPPQRSSFGTTQDGLHQQLSQLLFPSIGQDSTHTDALHKVLLQEIRLAQDVGDQSSITNLMDQLQGVANGTISEDALPAKVPLVGKIEQDRHPVQIHIHFQNAA